MHPIQSGIDHLLANPPSWKQQRIALVTNHAATTKTCQPARQALQQKGFNLVKLFSPEHGLDTTGADGHTIYDGIDELTQLPVISLYGNKLAPTTSDLEDIDLVLFDIPDAGARFYTYLWTMTHVMEACAKNDKPFIIADRPNPLSGNLQLAEGPVLNETHCSSFIGRWSIPVRHSCTMGELARYFNKTRNIKCDLQVIECLNYNRNLLFPDCHHSFVPLSPAIPTFESALLYPGLCFLEATNISEGRGTATPFRIAAAPWMQAKQTAAVFNSLCDENVRARPITCTPLEGKYAHQKCSGIMLHVTDPYTFKPVQTGWLLIKIIKDLHAQQFEWAPYPTHVNPTGTRHLDLLSGIPQTERIFEQNITQQLQQYTNAGHWENGIQPYLLYRSVYPAIN